jgi:hypothetical protein
MSLYGPSIIQRKDIACRGVISKFQRPNASPTERWTIINENNIKEIETRPSGGPLFLDSVILSISFHTLIQS